VKLNNNKRYWVTALIGGFSLINSVYCLSAPNSNNLIKTKIYLYKPWQFNNNTIDPHLSIATKTNGDCWTSSNQNPRPDAWRCRTGNQIFDPCFSQNPDSTQVICTDSPKNNKVTLMTLTQSLPQQTNPKKFLGKNPWMIKLTNDQVCYPLGGATFGFVGERNSYSCGKNQGLLFGLVKCHHSHCKILYYPQGAMVLEYQSIAELWY
jgi:hypothetical protein